MITYDKWLSNFKKCELPERRIKQRCSEIKESNNGADHSELVYKNKSGKSTDFSAGKRPFDLFF